MEEDIVNYSPTVMFRAHPVALVSSVYVKLDYNGC